MNSCGILFFFFCHVLVICFYLSKWASVYVNERRSTADCVLIAGLSLKWLLMCFSNIEGRKLSDRMCMCVYWECLKCPPPPAFSFFSFHISESAFKQYNVLEYCVRDLGWCGTMPHFVWAWHFRLAGRVRETQIWSIWIERLANRFKPEGTNCNTLKCSAMLPGC